MMDQNTSQAVQTVDQPVAKREKTLPSRREPARPEIGEGQEPRGAMLMRSTGLGKAELVAEIVEIKRQGDYLIMELRTTAPVRWKIRGGISRKDIRMLLRAMLKPSVIAYLLNVRGWLKDPAHPGDF
jgi:hypothetical protein